MILTLFPLLSYQYRLSTKQFDDDYTGTQLKFKPEDFEVAVNQAFEKGEAPLVDGYAPFCKHLFIPK